ncbi:staygreen family protein [Paraclostridium bifermentans]|uniref:staygreen family protein n=1 Tax=Paraclostridium bifermentans TaxID=1490 RepID=UPI00290A4638|nr:staygreen family protein [Paraclostridium bifermentans]MDU3335179.1 staygreen family protein [Paraclostridium bifermentans]
MVNLDSAKVNVIIREPYTSTEPVRFRKYTVEHKNDSKIIDVIIGPEFEGLDLSTVSTDIIYGQWFWFVQDIYQLNLFAFVGDYEFATARARYEQFLAKMPITISAIVNGDIEFLNNRPILKNTPVFVRFISTYPDFNKITSYGVVRQYIQD